MPKDSLNIYMTIKDGMSPALASITDKTKALDKETQQLQQTTNAMTKASQSLLEKQTGLQSEYDSSKKRLKEFQKAYDEHQDELSKANLDHAIQEHAKLKNELMEVTEQLNANKRAYKENVEAIRKGELSQEGEAALGGLQAEGGSGLSAIWGGLGIGKELSNLMQQAGGALLNSALGDSMGSVATNTLSSAITGASLGTAIAPGLGTAVGAGVGALSGLVSGATQIYQKKDDAFKDYYGGLYEDVSARSDEAVTSGSTLASTRESDLKSLSTLLDGDTEAAKRFQAVLIEIGRTPPFSYDFVASLSKSMIGLGLSTDEVTERIAALGEASAALALSNSDVATITSTLESIQLSGKLESRVLKTLSKKGLNVYGALADEFDMSEAEVVENLSELDANRGVQAIYDYMGSHFAGASDGLTNTYSGASGILDSYKEDIENAGGTTYNTLRASGMNAEIDALKGGLGDEMKEVNAIIGENRARKENLQAQYETEVMDAVLNGKKGGLWADIDEDSQTTLNEMHSALLEWKAKLEESKASGDEKGEALAGANIEKIYEEAQAMGQSLFDNSEFMKVLNDTELDEIQAILDNTAGLENLTEAIYDLPQQLSKGIASSVSFPEQNKPFQWLSAGAMAGGGDYSGAADMMNGTGLWERPKSGGKSGGKSHAFGLDRVPFDDYPALLHEGERVLTAREAREQDRAEEFKLRDAPSGTRNPPATASGGGPSPFDKGGEGPETGTPPEGTGGMSVDISGNTFVGASEEMADQLWEIIVRKLEREFKAAGR